MYLCSRKNTYILGCFIEIQLPISKSIANRQLILHAMQGKPCLLACDETDLCDDVLLLHDALVELQTSKPQNLKTLHLQNCGTAMRFLTAFCAVQDGLEVVLTGTERMQERPIGQLVHALRSVGAQIDYLDKEDFPPLRIQGKALERKPIVFPTGDSSQFVSALLLVGFPVETNDNSPYIEMTRRLIDTTYPLERDWSAASYWYEYVALYGGEIFFPDLHLNSLQGDKCVAYIFEPIGVHTIETPQGIRIKRLNTLQSPFEYPLNFSAFPDLYPAVYMTCHALGITLQATGTERLLHKESNRLKAFEQLKTHSSQLTAYSDHRIAMALLVAGYQVDDIACISKSYPQFVKQLCNITFVIPVRQCDWHTRKSKRLKAKNVVYINDEGKGKKWALLQGVEQATTDYVWLTDADVTHNTYPLFVPPTLLGDLTILPLQMKDNVSHSKATSLLVELQQTEYLALQSLTMLAAEKGHAVMCAGANMIVNRKLWLASYTDLHTEIPSGDDMFLLESFKRRGLQIKPLYEPAYIATIQPQTTWRAFFHQRMRWAGKAPKYTDKDILLCGTLTALANILVFICPLLLLIKFPIDWQILQRAKRYNLTTKPQLCYALLLAIVYPWYMFICLLGGLLRQKKW